MKCLVIEDEKVAASRLCSLINKFDESIEILDVLQSVKKSAEWFTANTAPDLIFMDIQLSDGLSFEIFEQTLVQSPVIFTTAYEEYALRAFKVNSIDYLLKPIDAAELSTAINKYNKKHQAVNYPQQVFDVLLHNLTNAYKSKFVIKVGEHIKVFTNEDIQCFYSLEKGTFLQNKLGRDYAINYSLDQLQELLDPAKFFRISRKYIVAFSSIKDIISYSNSRLLLRLEANSSDDLVISRERVQEFKNWLEN
jgi:DNA-binding LytR/AlgR family response regulator